MKFEALAILSFFTAYFIVIHLNVNFSILIIGIREESSDYLQLISCNHVVSVRSTGTRSMIADFYS